MRRPVEDQVFSGRKTAQLVCESCGHDAELIFRWSGGRKEKPGCGCDRCQPERAKKIWRDEARRLRENP